MTDPIKWTKCYFELVKNLRRRSEGNLRSYEALKKMVTAPNVPQKVRQRAAEAVSEFAHKFESQEAGGSSPPA